MLGLKLNHVSKRGHRPQWVKLKAASNFLFYDLLLISLVCLGSVNVWQNDCQATDINQVLPNIHYFMQRENVFIFFDKGNITAVYQNCII